MIIKCFYYIYSVLLIFIYIGCTDNPSTSPENEVDPDLVGEWYYFTSSPETVPQPPQQFIGMQITSDKQINQLGVETASGKIKVNGVQATIISATNNKLVRGLRFEGGLYTQDTLMYEITGDRLAVQSASSAVVYYKTSIDSIVMPPVNTFLSARAGDIIYENPKVYSFPSAYASKRAGGVFFLESRLGDDRYITIEISDFTGEGTYHITGEEVAYTVSYGDAVELFQADSSQENNLVIENYDETENRCSGKFSFSVFPGQLPSETVKIDAIFSVPVYR